MAFETVQVLNQPLWNKGYVPGSGPYGIYNPKTQEFDVLRGDTPVEWYHYLGDQKFTVLISLHGAVISCQDSPVNCRLTNFDIKGNPIETPTRVPYIIDNEDHSYHTGSYYPFLMPPDLYKYMSHIGNGYLKIDLWCQGIKTSQFFMVPVGKNYEVWKVELTNETDRPRDITFAEYMPSTIFDAANTRGNPQYSNCVAETEFHNGIWYNLTNARFKRGNFGFVVPTVMPTSFTGTRESFFGRGGSLQFPKAVMEGHADNKNARGNTPAAGLVWEHIKIPAGGKWSVTTAIGNHDMSQETVEQIHDDTVHFSKKPGARDILLRTIEHPKVQSFMRGVLAQIGEETLEVEKIKLKQYWDDLLSHCTVEEITGEDPYAQDFINMLTLVQKQAKTTFDQSRRIGPAEGGFERPALGVRELEPGRFRVRPHASR